MQGLAFVYRTKHGALFSVTREQVGALLHSHREPAGAGSALEQLLSWMRTTACTPPLPSLLSTHRLALQVVLIGKSTQPDGSVVWSAPVFLRGRSWGVGLTGGECAALSWRRRRRWMVVGAAVLVRSWRLCMWVWCWCTGGLQRRCSWGGRG